MAGNVTTLLDRLPAENIALDDLLYLVQGNGPDRDRKATLQQIVSFISVATQAVSAFATGGESVLDLGDCTNCVLVTIVRSTGCSIINAGRIPLGFVRSEVDMETTVLLDGETITLPAKGVLVFTGSGGRSILCSNDNATLYAARLMNGTTFDTLHGAGNGGESNLTNSKLDFKTTGNNSAMTAEGLQISGGSSGASSATSIKRNEISISGTGGQLLRITQGGIRGLVNVNDEIELSGDSVHMTKGIVADGQITAPKFVGIHVGNTSGKLTGTAEMTNAYGGLSVTPIVLTGGNTYDLTNGDGFSSETYAKIRGTSVNGLVFLYNNAMNGDFNVTLKYGDVLNGNKKTVTLSNFEGVMLLHRYDSTHDVFVRMG